MLEMMYGLYAPAAASLSECHSAGTGQRQELSSEVSKGNSTSRQDHGGFPLPRQLKKTRRMGRGRGPCAKSSQLLLGNGNLRVRSKSITTFVPRAGGHHNRVMYDSNIQALCNETALLVKNSRTAKAYPRSCGTVEGPPVAPSDGDLPQ
jgi:hypothetical protein